MQSTEWRAIPGFEGRYEASSDGQVRSIPHVVSRLNGSPMQVHGRVITPFWSRGYASISISGNMYKVHRLVAFAFLGKPTGPVVRHLDDNSANNNSWNLAYGTQKDNVADMIRNGIFPKRPDVSHCPRGHEYSEENTRVDSRGCKTCRACDSYYAARRAERTRQQREGVIPVSRPCDTAGCGLPHYARGLCKSHYESCMRRTSDAADT